MPDRLVACGSLVMSMLLVVGCGRDGVTITATNDGRTNVTVKIADVDLGQVDSNGGAAVPVDDCLEGPIIVTFEGGRVVELDESACPGQRLAIRDGQVEVLPQN